MRAAVLALVLLLGAAAGCGKHINPEWCATHSDPECTGLPDAGDPGCKSDLDCKNGLVCDTSVTRGECVECTTDNTLACPMPTCVLNHCAECSTNAECASNVCLLDGKCANESEILYVSPTGTGTTCSQAAKCPLAAAIAAVADPKRIIVLDPGSYMGPLVLSRSMRIIGSGATIMSTGAPPVVTVNGTINVELDYLTLTGSSTSGILCMSGILSVQQVRVTNAGLGIDGRCAITVERSVIAGNMNGAASFSAGSLTVQNNFFVNNGNSGLQVNGNVIIGSAVTGTFAFNTVAYNVTRSNRDPGVHCVSAQINATGNLISDNLQGSSFNVDPQVTGSCDFSKSYTAPGMGNNDLAWVNVVGNDFHLTSNSMPVLDAPGLSCGGRIDIDGERRAMGGGCDYGADELKP